VFIRGGLLTLAAIQASSGIWALVAPRSFYDDFPAGRGGWVSQLGPYNEHMTIDYGSMSLAMIGLLVAAAVFLERRLVIVAAAVYLLWAVPHFIYHLITLDVYDTTDALGNAIGLAVTVGLPLAILIKARGSDAVRFDHEVLG
jgi:hypothetical protein